MINMELKTQLINKIKNGEETIKCSNVKLESVGLSPVGLDLLNALRSFRIDLTKGLIPDTILAKFERIIDELKFDVLKEACNLLDIKDEGLKSSLMSVFDDAGLLFVRTYMLYKSIGYVSSNVVIIGANGCGKTTFADSIREQMELSNNGIVIPAQKILIFPTYSALPSYDSSSKKYEDREKGNLSDKETYPSTVDYPYEIALKYTSELRILLSALMGERFKKREEYLETSKDGECFNKERFRGILDDVIDIWNDLIEHRHLLCDKTYNLQIEYRDGDTIEIYPAYKMSDGERELLYVAGRVLLAKENSFIVVDEPELHLHKAILNKLWDVLEKKRQDCVFIYLTHDIDFAATRSLAKKCWLKSFNPEKGGKWDIVPIEESDIPEELLMKLLGSRKKILFCEGDANNSLDRQIYELIFPTFTIVPVKTCKQVIDYTRAFNEISEKYAAAYGIVDRDFRDPSQLDSLKRDHIYSFEVSEIENVLLDERFLTGFVAYKRESKESVKIIKEKIMQEFESHKELQAASYVTQKIEYIFKETNLPRGNNINNVEKNYKNYLSEIDIKEWYEERIRSIDEAIRENDYAKVIKLYNNKGLLNKVESVLKIGEYRSKAIDYLRNSEEAKSDLRSLYPTELFS